MTDIGLEGTPMIEGVWVNKTNNKRVEIRNSVIDGDDMVLITSEGEQISMSDFSQNYMQISDELYDDNGNVITDENTLNKIKLQENNKPKPEVRLDIAEDPDALFVQLMKEQKQEQTYDEVKRNTTQASTHTKKMSQNMKMLDKLFEKVSPDLKLSIVSADNFPTQQLQMLKDYYDVTNEDIAEYLHAYFFTNDEFKNMLMDFLISQFEEK